MGLHVEAVGTCNSSISRIFALHLERTFFYVSNFSRNLISVSRFVPLEFSFNISDFGFSLLRNSKIVGYGILSDGLNCLELQNDIAHSSLHVNAR